MENLIDKYSLTLEEGIEQKVKVIANNSHQYFTRENLELLFRLLDLTSLSTDDNISSIKKLCHKVNAVDSHFDGIHNVAAVCVYPPLVEAVYKALEDKSIQVAAVGANFPTSQTYLSIKKAECKEIINHGADEVDIVLPLGEFMEGNYEVVHHEIKEIKETIGHKKLKVILETGMLNDYRNIQLASLLAMEGGADFIKTSTGKVKPAATYDAVYIMAQAIKAFYKQTGKTTGIKAAGGISTAEDALSYYAIVREILGEQWLNSSLFRIGASRLANDLLGHIREEEVNYF
ncbi:MAG: deoxyribose-phosphate aldolase [Bacteroidales bacterium]|nr:deoxyribose-phosphate aldolase [Bacteroidales bacterium]